MLIHRKGGRRVSSKLIERQARSLKILDYQKLSRDALLRLRATSWTHYKRVKTSADKSRESFLDQRAQYHEEHGNIDIARRIRLIGQREKMQETFREIKSVFKPSGQSSIYHIEMPDPNNKQEIIKISDPTKMQKVMSTNFKSKFTEVYDTPVTRSPFPDIIGLDGLTKNAEKILKGTYVFPPVIHPDIIEFFDALKMPDEILSAPPVQTSTTPDTFTSFWKQGQEKIASSMSKLRNGHYIASTISPYLTTIIAELSSIPWTFGISPSRWRRSLNVALEKVQGVRLLSRLRTIHLLEADFNTGTKLIFAQRMMDNAYEHKQIPESQYARKFTQAIKAVFIKRLYFDYLRIYKQPGAIVSNDARGCFDRMVLAIGSLAFRRLGVPWRAVRTLITTIQRIKHYIRTAHGDSSEYYEGTCERPLQGGGQGNGAAGPMWVAISIILLAIIATVPFNATMTSAISLATVVFSAIMYVDDTDIFFIRNDTDDTDSIRHKAQTMIDKWCSALWISGGCLRPDKCWWYVIQFVWCKNGKWRYARVDETEADLFIPDETKTKQRIERNEVHVGRKTLGVFLAPDGNNNDQLKKMKKETNAWTGRMNRSFISRFSAETSVRTTIMKKLSYPLAALTISEKDCNKLMTKIKDAALPRMGINRKVGLKYLYGPIKFQGLAFPNLFTELCIERFQLLMKHGGRLTQIGSALMAILEGHQLDIGIGNKILDSDYTKYHFLTTDSIITHTWKLLHMTDFKLLTHHDVPQLLRINDSFLMKEIIDSTDYSIAELCSINKCCMYLQVVTISDITEGTGSIVTEKAFMGERDNDRKSKWNWPTVPTPLPSEWNKWRGALDLTYLRPDSRFLRRPLEAWISQPHQEWTWFTCPTDQLLYEKRGNDVYSHSSIGRRLRNSSCYHATRKKCNMPLIVHRTTVDCTRQTNVFAQGSHPDVTQNEPEEEPTNTIWQDAPTWIPTSLMRHCELPIDWSSIVSSIGRGCCIAVTDGSYDPLSHYATACWIIEDDCGQNRCKGAAHTPGQGDDMDAYRSELFGIYCIMVCLKYVCMSFRVTRGTVTIVCDCLGALTRAVIYNNRPSTRHPNFDLL